MLLNGKNIFVSFEYSTHQKHPQKIMSSEEEKKLFMNEGKHQAASK